MKSDKKVTKDHSKKEKEEYLEPEDPVPHPKKGDKDSKKSEDTKKSDSWKDEDWGERGNPLSLTSQPAVDESAGRLVWHMQGVLGC